MPTSIKFGLGLNCFAYIDELWFCAKQFCLHRIKGTMPAAAGCKVSRINVTNFSTLAILGLSQNEEVCENQCALSNPLVVTLDSFRLERNSMSTRRPAVKFTGPVYERFSALRLSGCFSTRQGCVSRFLDLEKSDRTNVIYPGSLLQNMVLCVMVTLDNALFRHVQHE